jgi:NTE family protein
VLVLAPYPVAPSLKDLPQAQVRALRPRSRTHLVTPDPRDLWAMGANPLDTRRGGSTFDTAREHGRRLAERVGDLWHG